MHEPVRTNQQYCCKCTHCADSPLGSRFAACGLWLTILNIVSYETYRHENRTIPVSHTKKPDRICDRNRFMAFLLSFPPEAVNYFLKKSQTILTICPQFLRFYCRAKGLRNLQGGVEGEVRAIKIARQIFAKSNTRLFERILSNISN